MDGHSRVEVCTKTEEYRSRVSTGLHKHHPLPTVYVRLDRQFTSRAVINLTRFATKVVNRWYCRKTMLIGDAAHVFPPFGGQGIATGIRDAQALSWRLAMMSNIQVSASVREHILTGWSQERRHAWEAATLSTKLNGSIVNQRSWLGGFFYRLYMRIIWSLPGGAWSWTKKAFKDKLVYNSKTCPDGFFLESQGGGRKVAQVWVRRVGEEPRLSDTVFLRHLSHLSILVLVRSPQDIDSASIAEAIRASGVSSMILSTEDITYLDLSGRLQAQQETGKRIYHACPTSELLMEGITTLRGYHEDAIQNRLQKGVKYVLLRPDFFIHSVAMDLPGLQRNLGTVREYFEERI